MIREKKGGTKGVKASRKGSFRAVADRLKIRSKVLAQRVINNPEYYEKKYGIKEQSAHLVNNMVTRERGGGIMTDGRLRLADGQGVGGNKNNNYTLIKDDRGSGNPYFILQESPSGNILAQGENFDEVMGIYKMFTGQFKGGGKMKQGYADRQDESLGMRTGRESSKMQSMKGRRDDSYGKFGKRDMEDRDITMKRGGKADWVQKVTESPNFRKGAFTKKAKKRGLSTTEFMKRVLANPSKYDATTRKQAQLMKNMND